MFNSQQYKRGEKSQLTCEYYLSRNKDKQHNSGFDHSVNQPWKKLRLIATIQR